MLTHKGFSAWITCDDQKLDEFETRYDVDGIKVTCWIPSVAGTCFTINWRDHDTQIPSAAYISLDGCQVSGRFLWGTGDASRSGVRSGPSSERPFTFAEIGDGTSKSPHVPSAHEVGTIILRIKQVQRGEPRAPNRLQKLPPPVSKEWSPTTGGHCTAFGSEVAYYEQFPQTWSATPHDVAKPNSFVKFVFRYRPLAFLLAQGIASASNLTKSSPLSAKSARSYSTLGGALTSFAVPSASVHPRVQGPASAPASVPATPSPVRARIGSKTPSPNPVRERDRNKKPSPKRIRSSTSVRSISSSSFASRRVSGGSTRGVQTPLVVPSPPISDTTSTLFADFVNFGDEEDQMDIG